MAKPFNRLENDVKAALSGALEKAAKTVTRELKQQGPYWSGDFEAAWEVRTGDSGIPADRQSSDAVPPKAPRRRVVSDFDVPREEQLQGYTIGNRMVYRDVAQDLEPGRIKQEGGGTAPEDWYVTYVLGGGVDRTLGRSLDASFRRENIS